MYIIYKSFNMNNLRLLKLQNVSKTLVSSARYATRPHHPMQFMGTQDRWREKDNVSKRWQLIYKAPMEQLLKYVSVYITASTTSVACGALYYSLFEFTLETMDNPVVLEDVVIANSGTECLVYLGAFVAFHAAVKIMLSKYVIRLYQDGDNYLAIFRGHTMNSVKHHEFQLKDVQKLKPTIVVSWGDARFALAGKHAILLENYFKTPQYYNYLLHKKSIDNPNKDDD